MKQPKYTRQIKRVYRYITLADILKIKKAGGIIVMIKYIPCRDNGY